MKTFLNEERRRQLMERLLGLSMPATMAVELAFLPDDMTAIDFEMAYHARHSLQLAKEIAVVETTDLPQLFELSAFLAADLAVLSAYRDEARERRTLGSFVAWMEAATHLVLQ